MSDSIPLLLECKELENLLDNEQLLIVDLSPEEQYIREHIPGAIWLDYNDIVAARPPAMGLLPDVAELSQVLSEIGLTEHSHVVAYDNENSGKASRLIWTLDCLGHQNASLLNGGFTAWINADHPTSNEETEAEASEYTATLSGEALADKNYIQSKLGDTNTVLLDTRTAQEYNGEVVRAARGGHIPGAVNVNWTDAIDMDNDLKLKQVNELRAMYEAAGITPDKEIITYCQTHHRSAHSYMVLKCLGYPNIRGYHGAWSDWGNDHHLPIEP